MKNILTLIVFVSFLLACSSKSPLLSSASYNYWYGGQKDVKGIKYTFKLMNVVDFSVDSLLIDGKMLKDLRISSSSDTLTVVTQQIMTDDFAQDSSLQLKSPKKADLYLSSAKNKVKVLKVESFSKTKLELRR